MDIKVQGGQMQFNFLSLKLQHEDPKQYEVNKAVVWLNMLNDLMEPVKWLKPNKNGTKVNFNSISSQEEYDKALAILEAHVEYINKVHGLDLSLNKK